MTVMGGAWLDKRIEHNERELDALIALSRKYDNIDRAIVGNETVLLGNLTHAAADRLSRSRARADQDAGVDCRAARYMAAPSGADPARRFRHRAHPAVLGIHAAQGCDRLGARPVPRGTTSSSPTGLSGQTHRHRRSRLAVERRPQGLAQPSLADEAHFLREWFNVAARRQARLLHHGSDRPAVEGSRSKVAPARTGACSTRTASRSSRSPAP